MKYLLLTFLLVASLVNAQSKIYVRMVVQKYLYAQPAINSLYAVETKGKILGREKVFFRYTDEPERIDTGFVEEYFKDGSVTIGVTF